ncbi:MAG: hypothetical protein RLY78_3573 [Pseudomonadota bacterium]
MLDATVRAQVKATAPVLQAHGLDLTRHFYARMFRHNPELKELFNQGHQRSGAQQQALAGAVAAYALHIDAPEVLMPVLERIAARHVSLGIRREHYAIVGRHLLASIGEVLGEAATPALVDAWAQAYGQLADILIGLEQRQYDATAAQPGGWSGWRSLRVRARHEESAEIASFELVPADGGPVPAFQPGQYVSVRVLLPQLGYRQPRQYSLSNAPGLDHLRISVKREAGDDVRDEGQVSGHLHRQVQAGDVVEVSPPAGDFRLHTDRDTPVVLISAGVGITPMMSMLAWLAREQPQRPVRFLHAARDAGVQAFAGEVRALAARCADARTFFVHETPAAAAGAPTPDAIGRLMLADLQRDGLLPPDADHWLCGPAGFMSAQRAALRALGVPDARVHVEAFGTGGVAD